jgi:hypothetical protein
MSAGNPSIGSVGLDSSGPAELGAAPNRRDYATRDHEDGDVLTLRPVRGDKKDRVRASAAKMVKANAKTLAKLAK